MVRYEHSVAAAAATVDKQPDAGVYHHQSVAPPCECRVLRVSESAQHSAHCLVTATTPTSAAAAAAGCHDDELRDAFQVFDKDKDGFLSATDLR